MDKEMATEMKSIVDVILEEKLPGAEARIAECEQECSIFVGCPAHDFEYVGLIDHFGILFEKFPDMQMEWRQSSEEIIISSITFEEVLASGEGQDLPYPKEVQLYPRKYGGVRNALRFRKTSTCDGLSHWVILMPYGENMEPKIESIVHDSLVCLPHVVKVSAVKAKTISELSEGREVLMLVFETLQMSLFDSIFNTNSYAY